MKKTTKKTQKRGRTIDFRAIDTALKNKLLEGILREEMSASDKLFVDDGAVKQATKDIPKLRWHDPEWEKLHAFLEDQKRKILPTYIPPVGPDDDAFWGGQPVGSRPDANYPSFDSFVGEIKQLFGKSVSKGYGPMKPDDPNQLYDFMQTFFSDDHALGEIVYKAIRYKNKRNPEDLVKIAGWAWLVFMHHWRKEAERGN
jgi:hypothetical protein